MKNPVVIVLLVLSLACTGMLWYRLSELEDKVSTAPKDYPLGEMMGYMQRYADKLWYAGEAGNWELAEFYQGEIAETSESIGASGVVKDGIEVSQELNTIFPPAITRVSEAVAAKDPALFRENYAAMIQTCNACHESTQHAFIRVAVPSGPPAHWNQSFDKR